MAFTLVAATTSAPVTGYSTPYRMSFCAVTTDDSGGSIPLNCRGVVHPIVTNAVDLQTFFGDEFNSQDVATIMKRLVDTSQEGADQLLLDLDVKITSMDGDPALGMVGWIPFCTTPGSGPNAGLLVQFIQLIAPEVAGTWRIDIQRRHSIAY